MTSKLRNYAILFSIFIGLSPLTSPAIGQTKRIDSLENIWKNNKNQDTLLLAGMDLMEAYFREGNANSGLALGEKVLEIALPRGNNQQIAWIYNRLSTLYNNIGGRETEALEAAMMALDYADKASDKYLMGIIYNNLGNVFRDLSFTSKALEFYIKSLEICQELKDWEGAGYAYKNIGITYEDQDWHEKALEYHLKSLKIRQEINIPRQIVSSCINVAMAYTNLGMTDSAAYYLDIAYDLNENYPTRLGDEIFIEKGRIHEMEENWSAALASYQEALQLSLEVGKLRTASESLEKLALLHLQIGKLKEAVYWTDSLGKIAKENQITQALIAYYQTKYEVEKALGNETEALKFFKLKTELTDSSEKTAALEEVVQQRIILDLIEKEKQFLLEKEKRKYEKTIYLILFSFLSILVFTLGLLVISKLKSNQELKEKQKEIAQKNQEIRKRNTTLEKEVEKRTKELFEHNQQLEQFAFMTAHNFRGPVARILGLGEILKMNLGEEEKKDFFNKLIDTTQELDQVIKDLNRILEVQSERDKIMEMIQLEVLLKKVLDLLKEEILKSNAQIQWDFQIADMHGVSAYVFSIFYNLISNAIKYAKQHETPQVLVASSQTNEHLILEIKDEGMGIDINKHEADLFKLYKRFHEHNKGKGMGLFLVKTQVEAMGGSIRLASEVGKGCHFIMEFPLDKKIQDTKTLKTSSKKSISSTSAL